MYPGGNLDPERFANTDIIPHTLGHMYFGGSRTVGYIFLDRNLENDTPEILEDLLEFVAETASAEPLRIVDRSPEALYGPSLAAIAFAAINVRHALERLKAPPKSKSSGLEDSNNKNKKGKKNSKNKEKSTEIEEPVRSVEFTMRAYGDHWARHDLQV
ncbi:hypothetical protein FRC12_007578 [Ceratobasidium sp. 428]|nr:hypothetical protein FRC12_007578 [Ceratobasidium sp. 428]